MSFQTTKNLYYICKANMGTIWESWNSYNRSWVHWELFGTLNVLECDKTILFYTKVYLDVIESFYFTKIKVSQSGEKEKGKKRPLCGFVMTLHPELRAIIFSLREKRDGLWLRSPLYILSESAYLSCWSLHWGTRGSTPALSTKIVVKIFLRAGYEIMLLLLFSC